MIAHGATLFLLLHSTDQRLEQFAETWCGDHYDQRIQRSTHSCTARDR